MNYGHLYDGIYSEKGYILNLNTIKIIDLNVARENSVSVKYRFLRERLTWFFKYYVTVTMEVMILK